MRQQFRQRQRAELALGELAVVLVRVIRKTRRARPPARALARDAFDRERVEIRHLGVPASGGPLEALLLDAAHMRERDHRACAEAVLDQPCGDHGRRTPVVRQDQQFALPDRRAARVARPAGPAG